MSKPDSSIDLLPEKPELSTLERIAIPGLLVGALYSAYATALTGIRYSNEIRNTILQVGVYPKPLETLSKAHATMLFWNDWIPLWCGNCVYALLIGVIIFWVPGFVMQHKHLDEKMKRNISVLRWVCVFLPVVGFLGNIFGGLKDIEQIQAYLATLK